MALTEKEAIKKIKNSFKSGLSQIEITRRLQGKGYKLEYIDKLIKKSKKAKKLLITTFISLIVLLSLATTAYSLFSIKPQIANPLQGFVIQNQENQTQIPTTQIQITPEILSYLLNEIQAYKLHKNYLTGEPALISFQIDNQEFYSEINKEIKTFQGTIEDSDITLITTGNIIKDSVISQDPQEEIKQSIQSKQTIVEIQASKPELIAKGYLSLYNNILS